MSDHLTPREVADRLRCSKTSVYRAIRSGDLPARKKRGRGANGQLLITKADAHRYFENYFQVVEHNHRGDRGSA